MKKILVINPGSTSTKLAVYEDDKQVWRESIYHSTEDLAHFHHINEQYEYRRTHTLEALEKANIALKFDAVIARGGMLKPTPGVYIVLTNASSMTFGIRQWNMLQTLRHGLPTT